MIEDIVKEIIEEAKKGKITISSSGGDWTFFSKFYINDSKDDMITTIEIPDFKLLIDRLKNYLDSAYDFYYDDKDFYELNDNGYVKKLVFDLFANIDSYSCYDIYNYIDAKNKMLDNTLIKEQVVNIGKYMDLETNLRIKKNRSNLEAPYQCIITFKDSKGNLFELPQITFGIDNDVVHIMCVQNKNKYDNELVKKMDRFFRKVNKGVNSEEDISRVSPNALVSLTIFNSFLKSKGLDKITTPSYAPLRYTSKVIKNMSKGYSKDELDRENDLVDRDQFNITNRMMYLLSRYAYHFSDCVSEYDDIKDRMNLKLNDTRVSGDNIIFGIDSIFSKNSKR